MNARVNLLGFDRQALSQHLSIEGFHLDTLLKAIHQDRHHDFLSIQNLPLSLRQRLQNEMEIRLPAIAHRRVSSDGTTNYLFTLEDGNKVEAVFIPEKNRGTLCVSSQVGCSLNCDFCSTGKQGFNRNLSTAEIIGQLAVAAQEYRVTNVVFMGMGEPLLNIEAVISAIKLMSDACAYGLAKRRITVSTAGVVPKIEELASRIECALAVSLHAPNNELRNRLVPINKKYPIEKLLLACQTYLSHYPKNHVLFEYVMLDQVNDSDEHAKQLAELIQNMPAKINLIPFNVFSGTPYLRSDQNRIETFQQILKSQGILTTIRKTRGDDILAACGQLKGNFEDRTRRKQSQQK